MAYDAANSLKQTIERLLKSSDSLVPRSLENVELAYKGVQFLEDVLKILHSRSRSSSSWRVNDLDGAIREAVRDLEDVIESHLSNQSLIQLQSPGEESHPLLSFIDLQDLEEDIYHFVKFLKNLKEHLNELSNSLAEDEEDEEDEAVLSRVDFGGQKSKLVGLADQFNQIKDQLTQCRSLPCQVISLVGMPGVGKTTLAKEIFEDPDIVTHFDCRVWVRVGRKCQFKDIPRRILAQVIPGGDQMVAEGDEAGAHEYLKESLKGKRYLLVLDDVWDRRVSDYLYSIISNKENGCRLLLTTRLEEVGQQGDQYIQKMRLLNVEESWDLLCERLFAEKGCPYQLENAGKKIAENCDGLPLTIVMVANLLSKEEKTSEYWSKVAEQKNHQLFMDAYVEISKVLLSSYEYLPQELKACFIFLGVFPQNYEISRSKLINMWIAEGLLEQNVLETSTDYAMECLEKLVSHNLVMVNRHSIISKDIKTCRLHSSFWHLCIIEARKNRFFHVLDSRDDGLEEGIKRQRRLCIRNSILFGMKDVYNSMEDNCAFTSRSLLCYSPYHHYPVPVCSGLMLLRVLDALTVRFYEFPFQILKLTQLTYLALTYDGELPPSISKLSNLQFLIVFRHQSIKYSGAPSYLPVEIWDMKELKHLQVIGSDLPHCHDARHLRKLLTLLDVSIRSCTKGVFTRISNLKKLGIRIEFVPNEPFSCFDDVSLLYKLESLKCVVINPELKPEAMAPPPVIPEFPLGLTKLTLSGLGYPWEYMSKIGSLKKLEVLKLQWYAFQGPIWEVEENEFSQLKFLLIEDTDLVQWKVGCGSFPKLIRLSIRRCYKLEELHFHGSIADDIEIVDCSTIEQINEAKSKEGCLHPDVRAHS